MAILDFLFQPKNELEEGGRSEAAPETLNEEEKEPEKVCPNCHKSVPVSKLEANMNVCACGHHFRIGARTRIGYVTDEGSFNELYADVKSQDPIEFPGYGKKLESTRASSKEEEAVIVGTARIHGMECALFVMEPFFMMGSMGTAVGEKITSIFEYATEKRLPVIGFTVSGGARMQEGLVSLMQMAKTSGAVKRHSDAGLLYITVLTDPTTGGVTASFAMEGDIILAEPGATVGFAGARVIEQTTRKVLPKGFQTAEFLVEHGFVDNIAPRRGQKKILQKILEMHIPFESAAEETAQEQEGGQA